MTTNLFHSTTTKINKMNETVKELREYGRFLGIRGLWRKNKEQLREHLFNSVFKEVNERMLRRPDMDPARAYMEAELSLRSKKLTNQKTWTKLKDEAKKVDVNVNRRSKKSEVERQIIEKDSQNLFKRYRKVRTKKSLLEEVQDLVAHVDLIEDGERVKRIELKGNLNNVSSKLIMKKLMPHIEMRVKVIYSFTADIYRGAGEVTEYHKTLENRGLFTSVEEIRNYIEECEQKRLDLENEEVWSKAYMPEEQTTDIKGNHMGKVMFKSVQVKLVASNEPLMGCGPLPEWLAKKRCIYAIDKYDDNLCVWRCLAIYKRLESGRTNQVEKRTCIAALELARDYYGDLTLMKETVRATKLIDFEGIAKHHDVNIMLYEPKQKKEIWRLVYGKFQYKKDLPTMNIGLLDGHCFYIKDVSVLAKRWECKGCKQVFKRSDCLLEHLQKDRCNGGKTKEICKGKQFRRIFSASDNVFYGGDTGFSYTACQWIEAESEKLGKHIHHKMCGHGGERQVMVMIKDDEGEEKPHFYVVDGYEPETNTVYQYHGCKWHGHTCLGNRTNRQKKSYYSTKARDYHIVNNGYNLVKVWECEKPELSNKFFEWKFTPYPHFIVYDFEARVLPENIRPTEDLTYIHKQVAVSVAIHDSLSEEPVYLEDADPKELTRRFMEVLYQKQEAIVEDVEKIYPRPSDFKMLPKKARSRWNEWVNQVPVYGFNSGKYDLNLIKEHLVSAASEDETIKVAKKDNSYMFLISSKLKFLDVRNYIAPGQNLDMWCKSMACVVKKLVFPYEWLDHYDKLERSCTEIVWQDFKNRLSGGDDEKAKADYDTFVSEYIEKRGLVTMREVLREYNIADVVPFVEAVEKTRKLYYPDKIDMLKDVVSIPGLSMRYALNKALSEKKSLNLYAPGGLCEKCRVVEEDLRSCDCFGSIKSGVFCEDCLADRERLKKCKCDENTVYNLLKTGMVGGPSIVFCRYHEAGVTKIRSHKFKDAKFCRGVIGYDANALYLYCSGSEMPCGKDTLIVNRRPYEEKRIKKFCRSVMKGKLFGFAQVDIEVPEYLYEKFEEMAPLFVVKEIPEELIPDHMKKYKVDTGRKTIKGTKKLCGVVKAEKILLYTPLIKWYLAHGLKITGVHQLIEYEIGKPFEWFPEEVANARREADLDKTKKILGDTAKLKGNSFYGKMIEDRAKYANTVFTTSDDQVEKSLRSAYFADLDEINGAYEIKEYKKTVQIDRPFQLGIAVYQLAKLRMLEFHYDFLDKYFDRRDYELMYMDTDSEYVAWSDLDIDNLVKPSLKEEYLSEKSKWLAADKFSERTPGVFKPEFSGSRMVALTAKCYLAQDTEKSKECCEASDKPEKCKCTKFSCKGVSKKHNDMSFQRYKDCLNHVGIDKAQNTGFRIRDHGVVMYEQKKLGLSAYYDKRYVFEDGIHTRPLM